MAQPVGRLTVLFPCVFRCSDENDIMLLFAKISRFPLFENSGFLVETGSFPDGRGVGNTLRPLQPPLQFPYNYGYIIMYIT